MFQFTTTPPPDPRGNSLPLVRCHPNKPTSGIITTDQLFGCRTHFFHGRTLPCDDQSCPACNEGMPWRWHGYIGLYGLTTRRHVLFESTAKAAEPLTKYFAAYHTLRGCHLTAQRVHNTHNGRVQLQTKPADLENVNLPDPPNILEALSIIWNIELPAIVVDGTNKGNPALSINEDVDLKSDRLRDLQERIHSDRPNGDLKHA